MRILIALCVLLAPSIALAELIPPGCYVADETRTDACYEPGIFDFQWYNPGQNSPEFMGSYYGEVMANVLQIDYSWRLYGYKYYKLAQKLKRTCGIKCKKIRL